MKAARLRPSELAEVFPAHKVTVSAWRRGETPTDPVRQQRLAEVLGVSVKWLLTGQGKDLADSGTDLHTRHIQEAVGPGDQPEGPGWQFGDPATWDEEQLLNVMRYIERTIRASLSALDDAGRRRVRYVTLFEMMRAGKEQGRPLPDFFYRVLHDLETGQQH